MTSGMRRSGLAFVLALGACGSGASAPVADAPSCRALAPTCGPKGDRSCCASGAVPGGTFRRSFDGVTLTDATAADATVSAFRLDDYLVTVGRFRAFVAAGQGTRALPPDPGAGAHARIAGSGWDPAWNGSLVEAGGVPAAVKCGGESWTDAAGAHEDLPMNCVSWFEAFAFCAWDGGFLPTEAEWNYAAAGGAEQRVYPWSSPPTSTAIDDGDAVFCGGTCALAPVGSRSPVGDGRWGQSDLAGEVWEWNLDWMQDYNEPCVDCAAVGDGTYRIARGGGFKTPENTLFAGARSWGTPMERDSFFGFRCARAAP
jgi:formylglycine-generating enzyme required for sulfatase activity